jgi:protein-disulfide isomerase
VLKGNKNARVGIVLYTDFQCPFCRSFARDMLPLIVSEYVNRGDVLLAVRQFPLRRLHERSVAAAVAARCAEDRGKFWEMHDQLFLAQLPLDEPGLISRAKTIGLDPAQFTGCLQGDAALANVNQDVALATANGVRGTPTIQIGLVEKRDRLVVTRTLVGVKDMSTIGLVLAKTLAQRR